MMPTQRGWLPALVVAVLVGGGAAESVSGGGHLRRPAAFAPEIQDLVGPDPRFFVPRSAGGPGPAETSLQTPLTPWEAIDRCVRDEMAAKGGLGAAVAIYRGGAIVYEQGYGTRERGGDLSVDAGTQFRIGSITKMFTAAAVMQEVDAGRVDLRAPITRYITELRLADAAAAGSITVWNLLTHTSGYPDNLFLDLDDIDGPKNDAALSTWVQSQTGTRLQSPPGTLWNYSNDNYVLAGLVAERASGVPYQRLMAERIFARAGLTSTTLLPAQVLARGNYTVGYWRNPRNGEQRVSGPEAYDNWVAAPAGYAFSTAGDLVRWAALLMHGGGNVISPASARAMQAREQSMDYYPDFDYGLGIMRERYRGLDVMQHSGAMPGWGGYLLWVPEADFAVATLVNVAPAVLDRSAYCAVDAVLQPQAAQVSPPGGDRSEWPGFQGDFGGLAEDGRSVRGRVEGNADGSLAMVFTDIPMGTPGIPLRTDLRNAFVRTFAFDSDGDGQSDDYATFIPDKRDPNRLWIRRSRGWVLSRPAPATATPDPPAAVPTATGSATLRRTLFLPLSMLPSLIP